MKFPLKNYKYEIPTQEDLGAFGRTRKFDTHTGIDLYCENGDEVIAMEDGEIVAIEWFTGEPVGMPWWNNTKAIAIKGNSGIINYCELIPIEGLVVGNLVTEGQVLGNITPVLKKDKGKVPSTSMLHLELYTNYDGEWLEWPLNGDKPDNLLDPTILLHIAFMGWISSDKELPKLGSNVEFSNDGLTVEGTLDYVSERHCILSYSSSFGHNFGIGFATDGTTRCEKGLVCDKPTFWRY